MHVCMHARTPHTHTHEHTHINGKQTRKIQTVRKPFCGYLAYTFGKGLPKPFKHHKQMLLCKILSVNIKWAQNQQGIDIQS